MDKSRSCQEYGLDLVVVKVNAFESVTAADFESSFAVYLLRVVKLTHDAAFMYYCVYARARTKLIIAALE